MRHRTLIVLCAALAVCSTGAALHLGVSVGRDGTTLAAEAFKSQPLGVAATCDLRSGEHFVLRLKAGYGVLLHRQNSETPVSQTYDYTGLDAIRVQAAPCAEANLPSLPIYIRAGMGCGLHLNWTLSNSTDIGEGTSTRTRTRGLDASTLLTLGLRTSHRLSLELSTERLLADWSLTTRRSSGWDADRREYVERGHSSGSSLNWNSVLDPGYAVGLVLAL
jgi:hypothetical protein